MENYKQKPVFRLSFCLINLLAASFFTGCFGGESSVDEDFQPGVKVLSKAEIIVSNSDSRNAITSEDISFGRASVSASVEAILVLKNRGERKASAISALELSAPFKFKGDTYPGTGGTCGTELKGGETCQLVITFEPEEVNAFTSTLTVQYKNGRVSNADSSITINLTGDSYSLSPTIESVSPTGGAVSGGNTITITGANFRTGMTVTLDALTCASVQIISSSVMTCIVPSHAVGSVDLVITNNVRQSVGSSGVYTYYAAPTITSVSPQNGVLTGGTTLTVTGTGFRTGATVNVGGNCTSVNVSSATSLTCVTPNHGSPERVSLTVTNTDGQMAALSSAFSYGNFYVWGQDDLNTVAGYGNIYGMCEPSDPLVAGGKLFQADTCYHRILVWNSVPTSSLTPPDFVLGQPDLTTATANYGGLPSDRNLSYPWGIHSDGTKLAVADTGNHRVLIWNTLPTSSYTPADVVLGQPNMGTNGHATTSQNLMSPTKVFFSAGKLIVADRTNSRVLIWNTVPTVNQTAADVVVGQPDMNSGTGNNGGRSAATLFNPFSATSDGTRLIVTDFSNGRVLIFNTIPTSNGASADIVLGAANMTSAGIFSSPHDATISGSKVFVADTYNNRVLVWNSIPVANNTAADVVLGQPDLSSTTQNNTTNQLAAIFVPVSVRVFGSKLFVTSKWNANTLIWNTIPTSNNAAADVMIRNAYRDVGQTAQLRGVMTVGSSLWFGDGMRVLKFSSLPANGAVVPDLAVGQPNVTTNMEYTEGKTAKSVSFVGGICSSGGKLLILDMYGRVLIWNSMPTTDYAAADVVVAQANMTSITNGVTSQQMAMWVKGMHCDSSKLYVSDTNNHRVLIWNAIPTANNAAANVVLGQANMTSNTVNSGGVSAISMNTPQAVFSDGTRLFVSDTENNRVLIWNSIPSSNTTPADVVLGQPNMTSNTANIGGISASTLYTPMGIYSDGTKLVVADYGNNRVLVWNNIPSANGAAADRVFGQPSMVSNTFNYYGVSKDSVYGPSEVWGYDSNLLIGDLGNRRFLSIPFF